MKELHELRERLCDELKEYGKRGELSSGTLDVVDKLAHALKNLDKVIETDSGYSGSYPYDRAYRGSYERDSRGRYSGTGYSRHDLSDKLRELMGEAPDEHTRMEIKRLIDKM